MGPVLKTSVSTTNIGGSEMATHISPILGGMGACCGDDMLPRQRSKGNSHPNDHVHAVFEYLKDRTNGGSDATGVNRADM